LHFDDQEECQAGFGIVVVLDGKLELRSEHGKTVSLERGGVAVVPHAAGKLTLRVSGEVLIARPPQSG
jgi:mannose-6-phosphate isomerase class I